MNSKKELFLCIRKEYLPKKSGDEQGLRSASGRKTTSHSLSETGGELLHEEVRKAYRPEEDHAMTEDHLIPTQTPSNAYSFR